MPRPDQERQTGGEETSYNRFLLIETSSRFDWKTPNTKQKKNKQRIFLPSVGTTTETQPAGDHM